MKALALLRGTPRMLLVLAPHPDDESLGCGLLLADRWARGLPTHVACLTDGGASHPGSRAWPRTRLSALRRRELGEAVRSLGGNPEADVTWLGYPDAALHQAVPPDADLAGAIADLSDALGAGTLLVASPHDAHCDHLAGAEAAARVAAVRPHIHLWHYPVWSRWMAWETGGDVPGVRLDLPEYRAAKRAAIAAHRSQMGLVVQDDPNGFSMPPGFADRFAAEPEAFVAVRA